MKQRATRLGVGAVVVAAALAVGSGTAGAANPGPPDVQLGVLTAGSAIGNPEIVPGLANAIGVLAGVPAVQLPPSPIRPGFGVLTVEATG